MIYKIVYSDTVQNLEAKVQEYFKDEWSPTGGMSVVRGGLGDNMYFQALIK